MSVVIIVKALRIVSFFTDPDVLTALADSIIELLQLAGPLALNAVTSKLVLKSLSSITNFAQDILATCSGGMCSDSHFFIQFNCVKY